MSGRNRRGKGPSYPISVRLAPEELAKVKAEASRIGFEVSAWMRHLVLERANALKEEREHEERLRMISVMKKVGAQ